MPPAATVTFDVGGKKIRETGDGFPVSILSGRVVPVSLNLRSVPFRQSGLVSRITVEWAGGTASASESDLWAMHAHETVYMPGFAALPDGRLVVFLSKAPEEVVAVATPAPVGGPWAQPSCASEANASTVLTGSSQHILGVQRSLTPAACTNLQGPQAIVLTGGAPKTPVAFYWENVVEELAHGRAVEVAGGAGEHGWGVAPNPLNWTWFVAGGH